MEVNIYGFITEDMEDKTGVLVGCYLLNKMEELSFLDHSKQQM